MASFIATIIDEDKGVDSSDPFEPKETVLEFALPSTSTSVINNNSDNNNNSKLFDNVAQTSALHRNNSELSLRIHAATPPPSQSVVNSSNTLLARSPSLDPSYLQTRRKSDEEIKKKGKKVQAFYRDQNDLIDNLITPINSLEQREPYNLKVKIAVNGSMLVNILLFGLQLYAAIVSSSLSLFATMADSFMDILSNGTLVYTTRAASKKDLVNYPSGKARMETTGIIIFSTLMSTLSLQIIIESIKSLTGATHTRPHLTFWPILCVAVALGAKFCLFLYCYTCRKYPSAAILMLDHRNDMIINSFGLTMSLLGDYIVWWLDSVGAILVAIVILRSWVSTAREHVQMLVGKSADPAVLQHLTYIALTHNEKILQVDTCRAYHAGNNIIVEVDIVMDRNMPLWECHDISESLQEKLESLPNVDRAFVHVDYETSHKPEHQKHQKSD
ncbi:1085_t:CDS:2 [Ambispora leptoticha]|uniref:1085_t:CDS:1 n=1 Tax=Ambispora leptoticha TaxID=144679 RepID=A0A9N9AV22_9GLOM|nr:1085_t:CDS:2 [Ambispora leptoticha]